MFSDDEDPDEEHDSIEDLLPDGVTTDQLHALVDAVVGEVEKLGLYCKHVHPMAGEGHGDEKVLAIHGIFTFGKVAFTPRVQNPEQDRFDDEFRRFEKDETASLREDILGDFRKPPTQP